MTGEDRGASTAPIGAATATGTSALLKKVLEAEKARRSAEQHYLRTLEVTRTAVFAVHEGRVIEVNPAGTQLLGVRDPAALTGLDLIQDLLHIQDRAKALLWLGEMAPGDSRDVPVEVRLTRPDGGQVEVELVALAVGDTLPLTIQLLATDITERKQAMKSLTYHALHDTLTGLPNRLLFVDRLRQALARTARTNGHVAVLFCDVDRFQLVNDSLGHSNGDDLLFTTAHRIRSALRPGDTVARFAGDEFVLLCETSRDTTDVRAIADRVLQAISEPIDVAGQSVVLSASLGAVIALSRLADPDELIRDSAAAMSSAKQRGRGRFELYTEATRARSVGHLKIENSLRVALEGEQLRVFYQPLVSASTHALVGLEALVRWQHPEHGFLLPGSFIPVAEDSGLIVDLGNWVLEQACRQAADWQALVPQGQNLHIAVNLSAHQLHDPKLVDRVRKGLSLISSFNPSEFHLGDSRRSTSTNSQGTATNGRGGPYAFDHVSPDKALPDKTSLGEASHGRIVLSVEMTETSLIHDWEPAVQVLSDLDRLGVRIAIDDFGTGWSSFSYLKRFPVRSIKIDQSFVSGVDRDPDDHSIVAAVIRLARDLHLEVVAEGVERTSQLSILEELGCDVIQGYLFGRPATPDRIRELLIHAGQPVTYSMSGT